MKQVDLELRNQSELSRCSDFDVRDMDIDGNDCPNKNGLMLTKKCKAELDNSNIGDGKLNRDTEETRT